MSSKGARCEHIGRARRGESSDGRLLLSDLYDEYRVEQELLAEGKVTVRGRDVCVEIELGEGDDHRVRISTWYTPGPDGIEFTWHRVIGQSSLSRLARSMHRRLWGYRQSVSKPKYEHDGCPACEFVGKTDSDGNNDPQHYDVWVCPQGSIPTVILRYSSEGSEYSSGAVFYPEMLALHGFEVIGRQG